MKSHFSHLGAALAVMLIAFALYGAAQSAVVHMSAEVAQLDADIKSQAGTATRIAAARAALGELAESEMRVQTYFVPETEVVAFIDNMQARGAALGAAVEVSSVESVEWNDRPALALTLTIEGAFDAVMRAVGAIEHAPYALSLTALTISRDVEGTWTATVQMRVGSVPAEVAPGTTAAPAASA